MIDFTTPAAQHPCSLWWYHCSPEISSLRFDLHIHAPNKENPPLASLLLFKRSIVMVFPEWHPQNHSIFYHSFSPTSWLECILIILAKVLGKWHILAQHDGERMWKMYQNRLPPVQCPVIHDLHTHTVYVYVCGKPYGCLSAHCFPGLQ